MLKGIDVSYAQGNIDFSKVNKNEVHFSIIRSSFGWESGQKDNQFERNYTNFKKLNIPVGAYHYSYATNAEEGKKEADYCYQCIKGKTFELPIYFDIEDPSVTKYGKRKLTDAVIAFCEQMKNYGYRVGIYTSPSWLSSYLYKDELIGKYNLWLAHWKVSSPAYTCGVWQYDVGSRGSISGISGEIDLDYLMDNNLISKSTTTNTTTTPKQETKTTTTTVTVNDKDKFLDTARSYIGKNGYYVCQTKLKLGAVYDWCCFAVSAIMKDCGFIPKYQPDIYGVAPYPARYGDGKTGTWFKKGSKTPQAGDLIFFFYDGCPIQDKYSCSHIGIVEAVNGNVITTLEGNVQGYGSDWAETSTFARCTRYLSDGSVHSFFRPNWSGTSTTIITTNSNTKTNTSTNTIDVNYKVYASGKWLPSVKNTTDYAGLENKSIYGVYVKPTKGHLKYRVKLVNGGWLPWVQDMEDFAGATNLNRQIDCIQMTFVGVSGYSVEYRVSTVNSNNYLSWVKNYNNINDEGYAGIKGAAIDKLQVRIVKD